ncbi:MAG: carbohydrate binding domain-containing protein [Sedimentisphaerales bacterium]|nr:carbohydrate binding domain-containing protein [Sedimentisphaerales bacterium]
MRQICFILIILFVISLSLIGLVQNSFAQDETSEATQVGNPSIVIDAAASRVETSPDLYGIFYEEISRAGEGGLSAELVQNRDFEATNLPDGWTQEDTDIYTAKGRHYNQWWDTDNPTLAWSLVADGDAEGSISLEKENPLNERNPHSIKLTATKIGKRIGVSNSGFWGMNIQQGEAYDLSFYARTEGSRTTTLNVSLENEDGSSVAASGKVENVGGAWKEYKLALTANSTNSKARLVISQVTEGTIWLDVVSLYPRKTFKGHGLRIDLCEMLAALKPSFMRFPGGCVVEGASLSSRWNWKETIGDKSQRRGLYNVWGYFNTYSLGYHELLQLSEDLNADAMYVCNVGMSCSVRTPSEYVQGKELEPMVQDALNALEYAMGPVTSTWGAKRAANGRAEPFKIKYIEIGNENGGQVYQENYRVFYDAIKAKYPDIITIADERIPNAKVEIVDEHFYVNPSRFFGMANQYDRTDRNGPKIYVGEYAVNSGVGNGNLQGALAEAVFMMNMEKNSDIVTMSSYAPLFENVNSREWEVNLIRFDNSRVIGRTSYEVQRLFSVNKPDQVLKTEVTADNVTLPASSSNRRGGRGGAGGGFAGRGGRGGSAGVKQLYALAGMDNAKKELVVKVVNPTADSVNGTITINGISNPGKKAKVTTLGHTSSTAENTLENPNEVKSVEKTISISGPEFKYEFSPNSLTILRIAAP